MKKKRPKLCLDIGQGASEQEKELEEQEAALAVLYDEVDHEGPADLERNCHQLRGIARGNFGRVLLGVYAPHMCLVAMKELVVVLPEQQHAVMDELKELHENLVPMTDVGEPSWLFHWHKAIGDIHPCENIVAFYGAFASRDRSKVTLVSEYMNGGTLQDIANSGGLQSELLLAHIALGCLRGLEHMHTHKTVHRDIKPANILVQLNSLDLVAIKLADLGLATRLPQSGYVHSKNGFHGTAAFLSPERIRGLRYGPQADIWALGLTLFATAAGKHPFQSSTEGGFFTLEDAITNQPAKRIIDQRPQQRPAQKQGGTPRGGHYTDHGSADPNEAVEWQDYSLHPTFSPLFDAFLQRMLMKDPSRRASAEQLLADPFLIRAAGANKEEVAIQWRLHFHRETRCEQGRMDVRAMVGALNRHGQREQSKRESDGADGGGDNGGKQVERAQGRGNSGGVESGGVDSDGAEAMGTAEANGEVTQATANRRRSHADLLTKLQALAPMQQRRLPGANLIGLWSSVQRLSKAVHIPLEEVADLLHESATFDSTHISVKAKELQRY
jgi:serine/threonine protein kinase